MKLGKNIVHHRPLAIIILEGRRHFPFGNSKKWLFGRVIRKKRQLFGMTDQIPVQMDL